MWKDPLRAVVGLVRAVWLSAVAGLCQLCTETNLWPRCEHVKECSDESLTLVKETVECSHPVTVCHPSASSHLQESHPLLVIIHHVTCLNRPNASWNDKHIQHMQTLVTLTICKFIAFRVLHDLRSNLELANYLNDDARICNCCCYGFIFYSKVARFSSNATLNTSDPSHQAVENCGQVCKHLQKPDWAPLF